MRRRFVLWREGGHRELVALWRRDVRTAISQTRRRRGVDLAAAVKEASMRLIEENCLSKGMVHLTGRGLGDLGLQAIRDQLHSAETSSGSTGVGRIRCEHDAQIGAGRQGA